MSSKDRSKSSSSSGKDSSLPPGWTKAYSNSQKRYFYSHPATKTSQWHAPTSLEVENPAVAKAEAERKAREEHGSDEAVQQFKANKDDSSSKKRRASHDGRDGEKKSRRDRDRRRSGSGLNSSGPSERAPPASSLDEDAATRRKLFDGLTFFFSREVPRGYLEVVAVAFGAKVGWEGVGSPLSPCDPSVTHHVVDRPAMPASFEEYPASREYVQPQWLLDCANFRLLLPCARYGVGSDLPPHLSPWVNNGEVGYVPEYAEEIERLRKGGAPKPETPEVPEEVPQKEPEDNDEEVHARELAEEVGDAEEAEEVRKRARKRKVEESGEQPQVRTLNLSISAPVRVKIFIFRRSLPPIRTKTRSWPRS
mmetsp:Transcript_33035/g.76137  ORF Transcript_33035/g.76137 Transcript_33035/m.76137 type:complete len:365 (-) Transcript_33035:464-1558(-)